MLLVNQLIGFGAGGEAPSVTITPIASPASNTGDLTTYTFSAVNVSAAAAGAELLVVVAGAAGTDGRAVSSVTIDGNGATLDKTINTGGSPDSTWAMAVARGSIPDGSVDIVVNFSAGMNRCIIDVFAMTGRASNTDNIGLAASSLTVSDTIDVSVGGALVAGAAIGGTTLGSVTWTGATEVVDTQVENANNQFSSAYANVSAGETGRTVQSVCASGTGPRSTLIAVSYAP